MSGRLLILVSGISGIACVGLLACDDGYYDDGYYTTNANEVVFGIRQRVDPATSKNEVTAGYDYIGLAHKGGSVVHVFRDGDGEGTCYFERFDQRLGAIQVESGVGIWTGGMLPSEGLQVLANQPETKLVGEGWGADDRLTFDVTGFAMPQLEPVTMPAPALNLTDIVIANAPADSATEMSIKTTDDITVTWTPPPGATPARVMVTLDTEEEGSAGGGVRCFGRASSGSAVIPSKWVAQLFSSVDPAKSIKGRVAVSSHRQVTYLAPGSWTAYIVATTEHRAQAFAGVR